MTQVDILYAVWYFLLERQLGKKKKKKKTKQEKIKKNKKNKKYVKKKI